MFLFHPSKRWRSACSSAPFWDCCVWRQCSASEVPEVKEGHAGRQGARPCEAAGSLLPPANLPPRNKVGGGPGAAIPGRRGRCPSPRAAPGQLRSGRVKGRGCDPHVRPGGRGSLMCNGLGGRRWTPQFPQVTFKFYFLNTLPEIDQSSIRDQSWPRGYLPSHTHPRVCVQE